MIEELPDSAFGTIYTIADYDNINHVRPATDDDGFRFPLWSLLYNGTAEHYPDHVRMCLPGLTVRPVTSESVPLTLNS